MKTYYLKNTRTRGVTSTESQETAGMLIASGRYTLIDKARYMAAIRRLAAKKKREAEKRP